MSVDEYLKQVYEEIDKEGMPYFEEDDLIRRFEMATYFFIEDNLEFIQNTQKAKEDFSDLTFTFFSSADAPGNQNGFFHLPTKFYRLVSIRGFVEVELNIEGVTSTQKTRKVLPIRQSNDIDKLMDDPFNTPTSDDLFGEIYQGGVKTYPEDVLTSIEGLCLKHPSFGSSGGSNLVSELPIHIQYYIIQKVILHLMTTIGDPRIQMQYYHTSNKTTDS